MQKPSVENENRGNVPHTVMVQLCSSHLVQGRLQAVKSNCTFFTLHTTSKSEAVFVRKQLVYSHFTFLELLHPGNAGCIWKHTQLIHYNSGSLDSKETFQIKLEVRIFLYLQ